MDNILRSPIESELDRILLLSNTFHPNLTFTEKNSKDGSMPFLDMKLEVKEGKITTSWYQKPTDTGLILRFRALATNRLQEEHRGADFIQDLEVDATSNKFVEGLDYLDEGLEGKSVSPQFYQPLIRATLD